ncbi:hypothetical protein [Aeromonas sanarellii]|uniref:hypothetical protein n=1 Tax=Aeromonas sanarellii TaxID=633415 RepID=UPI003B9F0A4D
MKIYNNLLANYLLSRRNGDHAMAFQLADSICEFWSSRKDAAELKKWRKVQAEHHARIV